MTMFNSRTTNECNYTLCAYTTKNTVLVSRIVRFYTSRVAKRATVYTRNSLIVYK